MKNILKLFALLGVATFGCAQKGPSMPDLAALFAKIAAIAQAAGSGDQTALVGAINNLKALVNPPPPPSACKAAMDFYDSSYNYVKSACLHDVAASYDNGCSSIGMYGFVLSNRDEQTKLFSFASEYFRKTGATVWINGKRVQNIWSTFDGTYTKPLVLTEDLTNGLDDSIAYCLAIDNKGGEFAFDVLPLPCTEEAWQICQYIRTA